MKRVLTILMVCAFTLSMMSCARVPSHDRSQHVLKRYFHRYGHKYKTTSFGQYKIDKVEVLSQQEIHKHYVNVTALIFLKGGPIYKVSANVEKRTLGWHVDSWEDINAGEIPEYQSLTQ